MERGRIIERRSAEGRAAVLAVENERLREAGDELIAAIERQLAMHGKGIEPSDRVKDAIANFRNLTK